MESLWLHNEDGKKKESEFAKDSFANIFGNYEKREKALNCEKHGTVKAEYYFDVSSGSEIGLECPLCAAEREKEEAELAENADKARKEQERIEFYKKANIEPEYWNKTFDDYKPITAKQKEYLEAIKNLVEVKHGKIIALGKNGTGKTMLASLAVKEMGGAVYTIREIPRDERDCMKSGMSEKVFEESLIELPLLVIDEIGRQKGSDFELNLLSYILDKRHTRNKPFIILSNTHFARDCPKNGCDKCFEKYFDNDLLSRFRQDGKFIIFENNTPDWRDPRNKSVFGGKND